MKKRKPAARELGKCDLDRVPHFAYELCENWRPIDALKAPSAVPTPKEET